MEHRKEGNEWSLACLKCREYGKQFFTSTISDMVNCFFATKVRDVNPDEAWFVTIYDFEPSARELCKRYGIIAVNGYELEELEEKVAKGPIEMGPVPSENRLLRVLNRQRLDLKRKRQNIDELRKVAGEINELRKNPLMLPPFLFPMYPSDLERFKRRTI
jgi:hypothetical protein